ncbi:MAG: S8 family serine peptidase [Blastocatellales bacterium]|nr:S8 family serine peptidase [Blastocatellales bacterium]
MNHNDRRSRTLSVAVLLCCFALTIGAVPGFFSQSSARSAPQEPARSEGVRVEAAGISASALRQIQSLAAEKQARTPAQRKISSQLLYAARMHGGRRVSSEVNTLEVAAEISDDGMTTVDLTGRITGMLVERIEELGGTVLNAFPRLNSLRARIPIEIIETIAELPEVGFIYPKQVAFTSSGRSNSDYKHRTTAYTGTGARPAFEERAERVRRHLSSVIPRASASSSATTQERIAVSTLSTASSSATMQDGIAVEGDVAHRADLARNTFGINGAGVKIGVLSDGVTNLRVSQARGALPSVTVLNGQAGEGDEGTAMLEIIHAVAPGAQLFFATAFESAAGFATNIRALRIAGCDIIVDDVFYITESAFQDGQSGTIVSPTGGGLIAQAVNDVTASGAMFFSSAGNSGNLARGTSGAWEGDFRDGGGAFSPLPIDAGRIHDFGGNRLSNQITVSSPFPVILQWSDPLGASNNDYDLYVLNNAETQLLAASVDVQNGTQDPFEFVLPQLAGRRIVIARYSGENRFLHLNTNRGRLAIPTDGQLHGHAAGAAAFAVAATPAFLPFGPPPNPSGPFPGAFSMSNRVQLFTSDGPRRLFFRGDGSLFTPGNALASGGLLRQKPDITAADGVSVSGVGFFPSPFYGTSAAAPHAAAIAALLKSANPAFTPAQLRQAMLSTAIDIEAPGADVLSGAGIVMPVNTAQSLGIEPMASLNLGVVAVAEIGGNGNGIVEAGESARLSVEIRNTGSVDASNVRAVLTSLSPEVFAAPTEVVYGDIAAGSSATIGVFEFTLSTVSACDLRAALSLQLNYTGGPSPKALNFQVQTGPPPIDITSTLDAVAPPPGLNYTTTTGMQAGRMVRTIIASACGAPTPFPGIFSTLARRFDAYTFSSCPTSAPTCVTVTLRSPCTGNRGVFASVYLDSYDPNNIEMNYLGDIGDSPFPDEVLAFSFQLPRGRKFVVVVHEINPGGSTGCEYTINVSGLCRSCEAANLICVQDDRTQDSLLFNFLTGDYLFTRCADGLTFTGRGRVGRAMGQVTLSDGARASAAVENKVFGPSSTGAARIRPGGLGAPIAIDDRNIFNNSCTCP